MITYVFVGITVCCAIWLHAGVEAYMERRRIKDIPRQIEQLKASISRR